MHNDRSEQEEAKGVSLHAMKQNERKKTFMMFLKGWGGGVGRRERVGLVKKPHMTFFREQFELRVAPYSLTKLLKMFQRLLIKLCRTIDIHDGFYRQEYWTETEINLLVLQHTASILWAKAQRSPPLQKMSA